MRRVLGRLLVARGLDVTTYDRARVEPTDASLAEAVERTLALARR